MTTGFEPRPRQLGVLSFIEGRMGVSAVPGSGKTWTLSALAAKLVAEADLGDDQEVLIVTLVNSAVRNFSSRVGGFVQKHGLLPGVGYRVRTLHGLAHDIVRERPGLVGLSDDFSIIDERASRDILDDAVRAWAQANPDTADAFLSPEFEPWKTEQLRRSRWPRLVVQIATSIIKQSKDLQLTPPGLRYLLDNFPDELPLLEMGFAVYADYQRALAYRGAVDFDDLIRLALQAIRLDPTFLRRLRHRWPYILEDEAQDSSRLQELILRELVGHDGSWVRVGDPNQAIYETFTTASPRFLLDFLKEEGVRAQDLPNSGRSMQSVIDLANALIDWAMTEHPVPSLRSALGPPYIEPTPPGDPQPNPEDDPAQIRFVANGFAPPAEITAVAKSASVWWLSIQRALSPSSSRVTTAGSKWRTSSRSWKRPT
ncbi:MAG: ATP-dependent helicase [Anaerolineae bacterium]|nr:ATP-dependent helicase [Anaerolineae bacterium]